MYSSNWKSAQMHQNKKSTDHGCREPTYYYWSVLQRNGRVRMFPMEQSLAGTINFNSGYLANTRVSQCNIEFSIYPVVLEGIPGLGESPWKLARPHSQLMIPVPTISPQQPQLECLARVDRWLCPSELHKILPEQGYSFKTDTPNA